MERHQHNFYLLFLIVFFNISLSYGQHGFEFKHYSIDEGLSQASAVEILQDSKGFIWIATEDGLNRFDGYTFKVFRNDPEDESSLSDNFIRSLIEDSHGNLWVGTNAGGLNLYDSKTESFTHFRNDPINEGSLISDEIWALLEHSSGDLWIGTDRGLELLDVNTKEITHFLHNEEDLNSISSNSIMSLYEDSKSNLWIGTQGEGLSLYDYKTQTFSNFKHLEDSPLSKYQHIVRVFYEDLKGNFWIGTEGGLMLFDRSQNKYIDSKTYLSGARIMCVQEDGRGNLWVGTWFKGLNKFDYKTEKFTNYKHSDSDNTSISGNRIVSVFSDIQDNLWIGTYGNGINFYDYQKLSFGHYKHSEDDQNTLGYNFVRSFYEEGNGNFWVGTAGGGLDYFDLKTQTVKHYLNSPDDPNSISHDYIRCMVEDKEGNLWIGTNGGGLNVFNRATQTFKHYTHDTNDSTSISSDIIYSLLVDSEENIWIGTSRGGLNKFDSKTRKFDHLVHSDDDSTSLIDNNVWSLLEDQSGNLWVGTWAGLDMFNPKNNTFQHYRNIKGDPTSISHNYIKSTYLDSKGRLWVGTSAGLNLFKPENRSFKRFGIKEGMSNEVAYSVLEDEAGELWISTNNGINRFSPDLQTFTWFTAEDGLQGKEFNTGAFHKGRSGKIYLGGTNGFNVFNPSDITKNESAPSVVLTEFFLFNNPVNIIDSLSLYQSINEIRSIILNYDDFIFGFEFSVLNYTQPERNQFAYKLEDFDKDWTYTDHQYRRATYTNIPPGNYIFKVKASNDDGYWNEEGVSVEVIILPPWWFTWWAKILYVLVPVVLFVVFYRVRVNTLENQKSQLEEQVVIRTMQLSNRKEELKVKNEKLESLNEEKDGILSVVAHDLRGPFGRIQGLADLITLSGSVNSEQKDFIDKINTSINQGNQLITDLLDVSSFEQKLQLNIEPLHIEGLLNDLQEHYNPQIEKKNQKLILDSEVDGHLNSDKLLVWRLIENLVSNAIKFTPLGKNISIMVTQQEDRFIFSIKDEGPGFSKEDKEKMFDKFQKLSARPTGDESSTGLGLSIVKIIVDRLQGTIEVNSEIGKGSEFIVELSNLSKEAT